MKQLFILLLLICLVHSEPVQVSVWKMQVHPLSDSSLSPDYFEHLPYQNFSFEAVPGDIADGTKMIVLSSTFSWNSSTPITMHVSPTDHPCRVYINNNEIYRFGMLTNPYVAVNYKSVLVSIPQSIMKTDQNNVTLVIYPRGERTPPPVLTFDSYEANSDREFKQTFLYYSYVCAFWIIGVFLSLLFFVLWFASRHEKKQYLFFALTSLALALGYSNVIFSAPLHNEPLLWIVARSGLVIGATLLMTFASIKAGLDVKFKWVNRFFIFAGIVFFFNVMLMDSKFNINKAYDWGMTFIITPCLLLTLFHAVYKLINSRTILDFLVVTGVLLTFATAFHDLYYVKNFKLPYFWALVYGYTALELSIIFSLAHDLWKVFKENRVKAILLENANRELTEQKEKLEHSSEGKTRFLKHMAHEFKTPLQGIVTIADILKHNDSQKIDLNEIISMLNLQMQKHLYSIQNVMDLSMLEDRTPEIHIKEFDLSSLFVIVQEMFDNHEQTILNSVQIVRGENTPEHFYGAFDHLARILVNILTNIPDENSNTKVTCFVSWRQEYNQLEFAISNGTGTIPERTKSILITGSDQCLADISEDSPVDDLALYVASRLIPLLSAEVAIEKTTGELIVRFPIKQVCQAEKHSPNSEKILVAEDNPVNRVLLTKLLEKMGYTVITAEDGLEAVEKNSSDDPALIFMDVQMPLMNGLEATRRIRENQSKVVIIALTANANRSECLDAGMNDFLGKPSSMNEMKRLLDHYLAA